MKEVPWANDKENAKRGRHEAGKLGTAKDLEKDGDDERKVSI